MRTERVITNYSKRSDAYLSMLAGKTLTSMMGNDFFPLSEPSLTDYETVVTDYRMKHEAAAETGGRFAVTAKEMARLRLLESMRRLAIYVNLTANGQLDMLVSSGFILALQPQRWTEPGVPLWVRLTDGPEKGQMKMRLAKVKWAREYEYQIGVPSGEDKQILWKDTRHRTTNSRGTVIPGLIGGQTYWIRVRARNGRGPGDWSDPVSWMVR